MYGATWSKTGVIFFWLTGETPQTLTILINRIESKYINYSKYGPENNLDLRNKVSIWNFLKSHSSVLKQLNGLCIYILLRMYYL